MLGNDQSAMLRRAEAASSALDKAAANPGNPFEMIKARREAESVVAELAKVANDDRALSLFKTAQSQPMSVFEASPGAAPRILPAIEQHQLAAWWCADDGGLGRLDRAAEGLPPERQLLRRGAKDGGVEWSSAVRRIARD